MAHKLEVVITANDKASKTFSNLGGVAKAAGAAIVAAIGVKSVQAIADLVTTSAKLESTRNTFNNLAASIGTTADVMLGDMRIATRGMVADFDLITATNKFVSMSLASTSEEAATLAEMATQLGMAMGKDANPAMEAFALLLANQSIPRLDTFGISAGRVRTRIEELTRADSSLTHEQAFLTAVMEEGEIAMGRVGEQSRGSAGSLARLNSVVKNTGDAIKLNLAPAFNTLIQPIAALAEGFLPDLVSALSHVGSALAQAGGLILSAFSTWVNIAPGWGENLGRSFANGLAKALPYIVGVIKAIGKIIAYWFAPGSPPKIAEQIDDWGQAMIQEFFGAFGQVPLGDILSLQRNVQSIFEDALDYGLVSEGQVSGMLDPVADQLKTMQAELINTGRVGEDSFGALLKIGGALGPSLVDAARSFFRFSDAGEAASGAVESVQDALDAITGGTGGGASGASGGGAAATADSLAEQLVAQFTGGAGAAPAAPTFGFDVEAITAQADSIASSITDKIFPVFDSLREGWANLTETITGPLEAVRTWVTDKWATVQIGLQTPLTNVKLWAANAWQAVTGTITGALDGVRTWITDNWSSVGTTVTDALASVKTWAGGEWATAQTTISAAYSAVKKWVDTRWPVAAVTFGLYADTVKTYLGLKWSTATSDIGLAWEKVRPWLSATWATATTRLAKWSDSIGSYLTLDWAAATTNIGLAWDEVTEWLSAKWATSGADLETFKGKVSDLFALSWDTATTSISGAWDAISKWASENAPNITSNITTVYDAVKKLVDLDWSGIELAFEEGGLSGAATEIQTQLETAIGEIDWVSTAKVLLYGISGALVDVTDWAADLTAKLKTTLSSESVSAGVRGAGKGLGVAIIGGIAALFSPTEPDAEGDTKPVWLAILSNLGQALLNIGESIATIAGDFVSGLGDAIVLAVTGEDKRATWQDVGMALGTAIGEGLDAIYAWLQDKFTGEEGIITRAVDAVETYLGIGTEEPLFARIGRNVIEGFKDGITNMWEKLKAAVVGEDGIFTKAVNAVKTFLGIASPSTVFTTIGGDVVQGLIDGISNLWANLKAALVDPETGVLWKAWDAVKTFLGFGGETPLFMTVGSTLMGHLMSGIGSGVANLKTIAVGAVEAARLAIHNAETEGGWFAATGKSILSWIDSGISTTVDTWAQSVWETIKRAVSGAATSDPTIPPGGGGGGSGTRAFGGPVFSGGSYLVGERGPEVFTPDRAGKITPNHRLGGHVWNVTINTNQSATRVIDDIRYLQMLGASA
jgi:hypothetical protein